MNTVKATSSFLQDNKHADFSERFQPVQASELANTLALHGFNLVHLKTGKAKLADRADFQTTVARYRSIDAFEVKGLNLDIILKVPHLYGSIQAVLGLFRGTCANQLNVGQHFSNVKVRHIGNPMQELGDLLPALVAQRTQLIDTVQAMQGTVLQREQALEFATSVASIRLGTVADSAIAADLLKVRRIDDAGSDLFTVLNVVQENIFRHGFRYTSASVSQSGAVQVRNLTSRKVGTETVKALDLNASIWDEATKYLRTA